MIYSSLASVGLAPFSCIAVLYESYRTVTQLIGQIQYSYALNWANTAHLGKYSTVMHLIGQIQHTWANTVQLCGEFI